MNGAEQVGWFTPVEGEPADQVLESLESAGFEVEETYGGQLLSDVAFEIHRSSDTAADQGGEQ